jgi:hypothetical protein
LAWDGKFVLAAVVSCMPSPSLNTQNYASFDPSGMVSVPEDLLVAAIAFQVIVVHKPHLHDL